MKYSEENNNAFVWEIVVTCIFIIVVIAGTVIFSKPDASTRKENNEQYVYYNVPIYTTVYEIVYPDSIYRYTAIHHSPSNLSSHRGSNFLYSIKHDSDNWGDRERPDYWLDEWNKSELDVSTTAPIRIVSETVTYKKTKYRIGK